MAIVNEKENKPVKVKKQPSYEYDSGALNRLENSRIQFEKAWGYRELQNWVSGFYQDGKIDAAELSNMTLARSDILLDYQIAQDLVARMNPKSPQYAAAQRVMSHLYHCYMLITNAVGKGKVYNSLTDEQKMRREARAHNKENLSLVADNVLAAGLLSSLATTKSRMSAEQAFHHEAMKISDPKRKVELQSRVVEAIRYMQQEQTNAAKLNQVLGLQR